MASGEQCCMHLRQGTSGHESTPPHEPALLESKCTACTGARVVWKANATSLSPRATEHWEPNLHVSAPLSGTCSPTHHQPLGHVQGTARSPSVTLLKGARCQHRRLKLPEGRLATGPRARGRGQQAPVPRETGTAHARPGAQSGELVRPLASDPGAPQELRAFSR